MRLMTKTLALGLIFAATVATAHEHVKNPVVNDRMHVMENMKNATGIMGDMMKGERPFDVAIATKAKSDLAAASAEVVAKFQANEMDPASEASPKIWENYADFTAKAEAMVSAAEAIDTSSLDGLKGSFRAVGGSCKACHEAYRVEKD